MHQRERERKRKRARARARERASERGKGGGEGGRCGSKSMLRGRFFLVKVYLKCVGSLEVLEVLLHGDTFITKVRQVQEQQVLTVTEVLVTSLVLTPLTASYLNP